MVAGDERARPWVAVLVAALATTIAAVSLVGSSGSPAVVPAVRTTEPYRGLGAWVDAFDFAPAYQRDGATPALSPAGVVASAAAHGVSTIYLQASRDDERSPDGLIDAALLGELLTAAHEAGLAVVAWYLPRFTNTERDVMLVAQLLAFEHEGHRFDGVALDIEANQPEPDATRRTERLVELSQRVRELAGDDPIGAIVLPPLLLEQVNPAFWPAFPWSRLVPLFDAWLPMAYWTDRTTASGLRDPARYTVANVIRMRNLVGVDALIHVIGGVADRTSEAEITAFARTAIGIGAAGASVYDFRTTDEGEWGRLAPLADIYARSP